MKQCYATVVLGWGHTEYECSKSGDGHCNLCNMPLSMGWTIGGHMQAHCRTAVVKHEAAQLIPPGGLVLLMSSVRAYGELSHVSWQ